jgi:hypothetical protein
MNHLARFPSISMDREKEKLELERSLARYRELAREFPEGPIVELVRDLIEDLEQRLRSLNE